MKDKVKRKRATFTRAQLKEMIKIFEQKKYISHGERKAISKQINVGVKELKIWWQNRRNKERINEMDRKNNDRLSS